MSRKTAPCKTALFGSRITASWFFVSLLTVWPSLAWADVVILESGGRVEGTLLDAKKTPRDKYVIETSAGRLTLDKSQVKEVIGQSTSQE